MYAPSPTYGFGPGNNQPASFNPNGAPQQHNPHQQQPGQPQQQHMMYNPQQFAGGSPSPYGASNPGMGGGNAGGGMGMMQNNGMAQMAGSHVSQYQTPYSGSTYGANLPVSAGNLQQNFMPTSNAPGFQMNAANMAMTPQQMQHMQNMQRMQPPPPSSTPTQPGPRASPFAHNNTPPNAGTQQSQFSTPQTAQIQNHNSNNNNQQSQATVVTPQTPNFPPGAQNPGGNNMAVPLSPGSESREKDRVTLLLEINRELLMEVMALQAAQAEAKKEDASPTTISPGGAEKDKAEKEKLEKSKALSNREYMECMRRLQANLGYLAAIADRPNKPSSQIPPHPAIISAPILIAKPAPSTNASTLETKKEDSDDKNGISLTEDRNQRIDTLKAQYKKLQDLFPGVDPKKEQMAQSANPTAKQAGQTQGQTTPKLQQGPNQASGQGGDPNAQQRLQNDQFRQKMLQQAQAQAQAQAQSQGR